ncbi:STAS domain-containing protein [Umezawaea sp. Da 62-37]|uniref:STAS domain-containing protein n=1 Tax=Umezawaea sp. Da 62-37 TaxID=3075927 RepID=UPI0028F6C646|nr:STAS domain-containing protein [Umezawaea sp. Da 62-37]WNV85241.1 STAS domain-containing protein [Umezawaea sp. Da 62-37]
MLITSGADLLLSVDHTPTATIVTVSGELDATAAQDLEDHLDHVDTDRGVMVLDLTGVTFCDSVGLASLLDVNRRGIDLRVVGSRQVARTVTLAGMDSEVPLFGSVSDATGRRTRRLVPSP